MKIGFLQRLPCMFTVSIICFLDALYGAVLHGPLASVCHFTKIDHDANQIQRNMNEFFV